jgi:predicted transcriptional regulator
MRMLSKDKVLDSLKGLPDKFSIDELFERMILLSKIETGLEQAQSGKSNTTDEAKDKLKKWLK